MKLILELLDPKDYLEYENFVMQHPMGSITQSVRWHNVKNLWDHEVVVVRDGEGNIEAGVSILIRQIPVIGTSMIYAPRGPVCDIHNSKLLEDLQQGINLVAQKYNAHLFKMDPDILQTDEVFTQQAKKMGYHQYLGEGGFETIQARFNYRLYLDNKTEDDVFMGFTQMCRRNVRKALKNNVEIRIGTLEDLDEFMRLMKITGERDGFSVRPKSYFENMMNALGEHVRLYLGYYEGQALCGAITTNYAGKTCYLYGASDNQHRDVMATYLIQWEMIRWAMQTNCSVYDFQGISGNFEDETDHLYGLYRFKKGFGGQVDALAGEFDFIYKPFRNKMVDAGIHLNDVLRALKRRFQ